MLQWHLGIFAWEYTPSFRGYDSYLGYLGGAQDYWAHSDGPCTPTAASNWQCPTRVNGSDYASLDFVFQQQPNCGAGCSTFPAQYVGNCASLNTHTHTHPCCGCFWLLVPL